MQTDITVHNTDQKEGNAMNHNPNRGNNRKEKKMNAVTKTTSVAVLVTVGLALGVQAAEPPKPDDTRSGSLPFTVKVTKEELKVSRLPAVSCG